MSALKSFVIGSSFPVFILFFLAVRNISNDTKNYSYDDYTIVAPIYLGTMNVISLYLSNYLNLSLRERYLLIGIISPIIVIVFGRLINSYNYTNEEWLKYSIRLIIKHFTIYNVIMYNLELNIA